MRSQSSRAEDTAAFLLEHERAGSPVMIPGAFEKRALGSAAPGGHGTGGELSGQTYVVTLAAAERLVYEREGGGAPSERSGERSTAPTVAIVT